jgi:alkylation response protein AidB-like acyl-CoA dehydrogenase
MWHTLASPYYNDTHRALRRAVRAFVDKEITPYCHEWDEAKQLPRAMFKKAAEAGILAAVIQNVPKDLCPYPLPGGVKVEEFDPFHGIVTMDELSRCGSGGVVWSICGGKPPSTNPSISAVYYH